MTKSRVRCFLLCQAVGLLAALCPAATTDLINPDPNALGPGQLWYRIILDYSRQLVEGQGWGYGNRWFYYPSVVADDGLPSGVYRQWYYRGPYDPHVGGLMAISAGIQSLDSGRQSWADVHFIWTTPEWSALGTDHPPLPEDVPEAANEWQYLGRSLMYSVTPSMFGSVEPWRNYTVSDYSPEWVGIEVIGAGVNVVRWMAPQGVDTSGETPSPYPVMDFGDAPDSYGTRLASDGARHVLVKGVYLGKGVDAETDALPGYDADGDDTHGDQDEDGVVFVQPLAPGCATAIDVTASTDGYLNAWIDYGHDATFNGSTDQVFADKPLAAGVNHLTFLVPATAAPGATFARFRFNRNGVLGPTGEASDGEVEDYKVVLAGACGSQSDTGAVVLMDSFDDNVMGRLWYLDQPDAGNVWLDEANDRLELQSKASATGKRAQYSSSYWKLDAGANFSLKTDYSYTAVTAQGGWLSVRFSPNASAEAADHVDFNVGCDSSSPKFRFEVVCSGITVHQGSLGRSVDSGTLYVSYDADLDELYLSTTGPGRADAWQTVSGVLKGQWGGAALSVAVGGTANGLALSSGQAWLDDFIVQSGTLKGPIALNRFWSAKAGQHFYTMSETERRKLIDKYARNIWNCEGVSYYAFPDANEPGTLPVYRFWRPATGEHFFTMKESEREKLMTQLADVYTYEAIAFYAYPADSPSNGAKPVYRFWSPKSGEHFYTISQSEKDKIIANYSPSVWTYEGVAWCAYE